MSIPALTLREMVVSVLQDNNEQPLKPSEIAAMIKERYPDYCAQKAAATTQNNFNVVAQIASEISANSKQWMLRHPELKSSDETPRTYWLEALDDAPNEVDLTPQAGPTQPISAPVDEQRLYPKLAAYLWGMKARKLYPKRIDEKTSANTNGRNGNKSLHPDMVALEDLMPSPVWSAEIKEWARLSGAAQSKLWSFEVKIRINSISDARDFYFQALANSAWANFGYLVAAQISDKALGELKTLAELHGVGVILLDPDNPADGSVVKIPARERSTLDWGTCNRIASQNADFRRFLEQVSHFHLTRKTRDSDWDIRDTSVGET